MNNGKKLSLDEIITRDNIEPWDKCSKTDIAKKLSNKVIKEILGS